MNHIQEVDVHYGYQWWVHSSDGFYAAHGAQGQNIIVIPEYDIVVVFTARLQSGWPFPGYVRSYIIPAAEEGFVSTSTSTDTPISPYLIPAIVIAAIVVVVILGAWIRFRRV
jgi:hypothetical protein